MEEENNFGSMDHIMKVIGSIIVNMVKVDCFWHKETFMKENGKMIKFMVL